MGKIIVKQIRGTSGQSKKNKAVLQRGLGLRRIGHTKEFKDNNCIRGMVNKVSHLVSATLVEGKE